MLLRSRIDGIDRPVPARPTQAAHTTEPAPPAPTRLVDVAEWLDRANPVRAFTPDVGDYVPRHRKEHREA